MRKLKGFTIVEVLVVISIIGIVMVMGAAQYREFAQRQAVVSAKRQIMADVRAAQSDASSGRKPEDCTANHTLSGYGVRVTSTSPARYETYAICVLGGATLNVITKQTTLSSGITITQPPAVIFKPLGQGTNLNQGTSTTITITSSTGSSGTLVISASGEII